MQLTAQQLSLLLDEVAAMARADRPLALGLAELNHPSLGRIGRAAGLLSKRIAAGQAPDVAIQELAGRGGKQAAAALQAMQANGSAEPIIRLADAIRRQSGLRLQLWVTMIYPLITMLIAYLLVSLGVTTLVIDHWPNEIIGKADATGFISFCISWRKYFWLPPLVFGLLVVAYYFARVLGVRTFDFASRTANQFAWSTFCDMLAVQLLADVPLPNAISLAADATANGKVCEQTQGTPGRLGGLPPLIGWLLAQAAKRPVAETATELRVLSDWYRHQAMRRSRFWIRWLPSITIVLVGGGAGLCYCLLVLRPLFEGMVRVAQ